MGLRTCAWPSCEGLRAGTKTSPGPSAARLGLNRSPLITGRPRPGPQPAEEQSVGLVPVSAEALPEPSVSTREAQPEAPDLPLTDDGIA